MTPSTMVRRPSAAKCQSMHSAHWASISMPRFAQSADWR